MMNNILFRISILIIFALIFKQNINAQNEPLKTIPFYFDSKIVSDICDSLESIGIDSTYIFLAQIESKPYTFLIWKEKRGNFIFRIEDSLISYTKVKNIDFIKGDYKKLAVREKEKQLQFTAPLDHDPDCSCFIFKSNKTSFLIEGGSNCMNFVLEKCKKPQREKFINSIKENLQMLNASDWIFFMKYERYSELK